MEKADFPVLLTGLGTVQGFNTVVVRTRVDGQIDQIAFKEGDLVEQGDLLVADRSPPLPGRARSGQSQEAAGRGQPRQRQCGLAALHKTRRIRHPAAARHPALHGGPAHRANRADDAAIFNAQTQLDYATVKSPISGVAGLRQVDVGNIVNASTQTGIVTITQIEPIAVIFSAPEGRCPTSTRHRRSNR